MQYYEFLHYGETKLKEPDPRKVGNARVSTKSQNLNSQIDQLKSAGCYKIFVDKLSGENTERHGWQELLGYIRSEGSIVVTELSRMSRSLTDLLALITDLEKENADIFSLSKYWA